jgi:hypothetical protein
MDFLNPAVNANAFRKDDLIFFRINGVKKGGDNNVTLLGGLGTKLCVKDKLELGPFREPVLILRLGQARLSLQHCWKRRDYKR